MKTGPRNDINQRQIRQVAMVQVYEVFERMENKVAEANYSW